MRELLLSHLDRRQKLLECIRKGWYNFVFVKYAAYLFLLVFLVDQGFLETLACLVILAHPVALEPLADLAHQEVPRWFVLRQTGLESGSESSYILPYDLSGKSHNFQVAVENLDQQSLNRVLAGSQGCGLSCFGITKLCACWGRNSRLGRAQKMEELLCKIYFLTLVRVLGAFVFYIYKNLKLFQQKLLHSVIAWRQFQLFFRWLMLISSSWT